jgi:hypothetical protein
MLQANALGDVDVVRYLAEQLHLPTWLVATLTAVVAAALLLVVLAKLSKRVWREIRPVVITAYGPARQAELEERRTYCRWVRDYLTRLAAVDSVRDDNYAELEAEVEIERPPRLLRLLGARRERVSSLSKALQKVDDRFCVVEGEPGSGKSVALRHVAMELARHGGGLTGLLLRRPLPVYLNLKDLDASYEVSPEGIQAFVMASFADAPADIVDIFSRSFPKYMRTGRLFFLMDSFDEIPRVLAAAVGDPITTDYAMAIHGWLPSSPCRLIVASRHFHGPRRLPGVRFKIVRLSVERQRLLVKRAFLGQPKTDAIYERLAGSEPWVADVAANPMWLGLLVDHLRNDGDLPPGAAPPVFETFIGRRLALHTQQQRYRPQSPRLQPDELREAAERIAYVLTSDGLGLQASRERIEQSLRRHSLWRSDLPEVINELVRLKIMRSGAASTAPVTFTHRRLQERLTTSFLLDEQHESLVPPKVLLTDGRWREIAVTICQRPREEIQPILRTIQDELLLQAGQVDLPDLDLSKHELGELAAGSTFRWPADSQHLLALLAEAFPAGSTALSPSSREAAGTILRGAALRGGLIDRKLAVTLSSAADNVTQVWLVERAFAAGSPWLSDAAYTQVGRLPEVTATTAEAIRHALMRQWGSGQLRAAGLGVVAEIRRIRNPGPFLALRRLLLAISTVDVCLLAVTMAVGISVIANHYTMRRADYIFFASLALWSWGSFHLLRVTAFGRSSTSRGLALYVREAGRLLFPRSYLVFGSAFAFVSLLLARLGLALVLIVDVSRSVQSDFGKVAFAVAVFYYTTWAFSAIIASHLGRYNRAPWWPILPGALLWLAGTRIPLFIATLRRLPWKRLPAFVLSTAGIYAVVISLAVYLRTVASPAVSYAVAGVFVVLIVIIFVVGTAGLIRRLRDRHFVNQWWTQVGQIEEFTHLISGIESARTVYGAYRIMSVVRHDRLLSAQRSVAFLTDFITAASFLVDVERDYPTASPLFGLPMSRHEKLAVRLRARLTGPAKGAAPTTWPLFHSTEFQEWFRSPGERRQILKRFGGDALEEACRAAEAVGQ